MLDKILEMAVKTEILIDLPEGLEYKIVDPKLGTMLGTMFAVAYLNEHTPLRFICKYHHYKDSKERDLFIVQKLTDSASRDDGTDYLDRKE